MKTDSRYKKFFILFENEEYFESHEVLEEVWIDETNCDTKNHPAIVLLQFSVALLHWKRKNFIGASKLMESALLYLKNLKSEVDDVGVNSQRLEKEMDEALKLIKAEKEYRKIELSK